MTHTKRSRHSASLQWPQRCYELLCFVRFYIYTFTFVYVFIQVNPLKDVQIKP
jgi:hypothetical protein